MAADVNAGCLITSVFQDSAFLRRFHKQICRPVRSGARCGFKYLFQRLVPGLQGFLFFNHCAAIGELRLLSNFTDHRVAGAQTSHLIRRNFTDDVSEIRTKQIPRVQIVLYLHTQAVPEGHLTDSDSDAHSVEGISRCHTFLLHILVKLVIDLHHPVIDR